MLRFIISAEKIRIINQTEQSPLVKYYATVFSGIIAALLISSFVSRAYAADLQVALVPQLDKAEASYIGVKTVTLKYPAGSSLAQELNGKNERVQFELNGTANNQDANGTSELINAVNRAFAQAQSPVQIQQAAITYTAVLKGGPDSTLISYKLDLEPTIEKYLISMESSGDIIDLEWRGIVIQDPLVVTPQEVTATPSDLQVGEIDVNHPIGLLQAIHPSVAEKLSNTPAGEVLQDPILDFKAFDTPMGSWHRLFDPVGTYGGSVGLDTGGAKALSVYSLGESSLREGAYTETEKDATATIEGAEVSVHSTTPPPSGQITIAGYADHQENQGVEFAIVTIEAPAGVQTSTGGFPIQVLLVLGGMMGAVAIFVLLKARK
jgi:hypothetical protein